MLKNQMCQTEWAKIWHHNNQPLNTGPSSGFPPCMTLCGSGAFLSTKSLETRAEGAVITSNGVHHHARRNRRMGQIVHGLLKLLSGSELCPLKFHWTKQDIWPQLKTRG